MFGVTGENLTANIRQYLMRGILFKQVCWFDTEKRAPGVLTSILSEDVMALNGMTTDTLSTVIEAILGLMLGVTISSFFCWQQALVTILAAPILLLGVVAMSKLQWKRGGSNSFKENNEADPYEKSAALISDVIMNYRTVVTFGDKQID